MQSVACCVTCGMQRFCCPGCVAGMTLISMAIRRMAFCTVCMVPSGRFNLPELPHCGSQQCNAATPSIIAAACHVWLQQTSPPQPIHTCAQPIKMLRLDHVVVLPDDLKAHLTTPGSSGLVDAVKVGRVGPTMHPGAYHVLLVSLAFHGPCRLGLQ